MTTSKAQSTYVWVWLPQRQPVLCGRLVQENQHHLFIYAHSYLQHENAIALDPVELPLASGFLLSDSNIHRAIRDAAPDAWGRRVILYQAGLSFAADDELSEIDFLSQSNSNRIGALHFQASADHYSPTVVPEVSLEELMDAAQMLELGKTLPRELNAALLHGTSIGGARPKAFLNSNQFNKQYIVKFSSQTDLYPIVKAEFVAMQLAKVVGINVAETRLHRVLGKDVLLVERFDRVYVDESIFVRRFMISALTALALHEMEARYASYLNLADFMRKYSSNPVQDMQELYQRMVFNLLIGNTDDHARNHAFFWDGKHYQLTPAYDICPNLRIGNMATQAMQVGREGAKSTLKNALSACERFGLTKSQANNINNELVTQIRDSWLQLCEQALLGQQDRLNFERATILSSYCFED